MFAFISAFTFAAFYMSVEDVYRSQMETMGETDLAQSIHFTSVGADLQAFYKKMTDVLDKYRANLYTTRVSENNGADSQTKGKSVVVKYVYVNRAEPFKDIAPGGRLYLLGAFPPADPAKKESEDYMTTDNKDGSKSGLIDSFRTDEIYEIRTLASGVQRDPDLFTQACVLQVFAQGDEDKMISEWSSQGIAVTKLKTEQRHILDVGIIYLLVGVCLIVFLLVMVHDILYSSRRIAVEKMQGFSVYAVWKTKALGVLVIFGICSVLVMLIGSLIFFQKWTALILDFLFQISGILLGMWVLSGIFLSLPFLYIHKIRVAEMLQNKQGSRSIVIFNAGVKFVATTVLVIYSAMVFSELRTLLSRRDTDSVREMGSVENGIFFYGVMLMIMVVIIILVLWQNTMSYMNTNRVRIALKQTLGYGTFDKFVSFYYAYFISWAGTALVSLSVSLFVGTGVETTVLCVALFVFEGISSIIIFDLMKRMKRQDVLRITKGG